MKSKKIGVIVEVDGGISRVGVYSLTNDADIFWYGDILSGPKIGAFVTINQNDIKIIATVSAEKVVDQQNTVKSVEFDNRYNKNSINRELQLRVKGVIENGKFEVTSKYVPMIGNQVTITTREELNIIYGIQSGEEVIGIGESILENYPIYLSINNFFASHIGIFGNTGSGKSNTLHKLYLELFKTNYYEKIVKSSQFFVIDFNGEYTAEEQFGVHSENKKIYDINTRHSSKGDKLPIKKDYLLDADILSILFDARPATQVPFLRSAIETFKENMIDENKFADLEIGLLKKILEKHKGVSADSLDNWIKAGKNMGIDSKEFEGLENNLFHNNYGSIEIKGKNDTAKGQGEPLVQDENITQRGVEVFRIEELRTKLKEIYGKSSLIRKLEYFLEFQKVYVSAWKKYNIEHINPLFKRIETSISSLEKVVDVKDEVENEYKTLNIISLVNANQEISRLLPMLLSKMIYDEQKDKVTKDGVRQTKHLIVDEAHNILNSVYRRNGDDWQDYRLTVFEEIIKEGRKFGFYMTLSSQRPADISPTILSQVHNFLIHRLVNENDLRMLENTMPTLDKNSYSMIPSLGQGEAIITGNAMKVPVFVKIEKERNNRPKSDDVELTKLWEQEN